MNREGFCTDVKPIKNLNIDKVVLKCGCGEMESSVKDFMEKKTQMLWVDVVTSV